MDSPRKQHVCHPKKSSRVENPQEHHATQTAILKSRDRKRLQKEESQKPEQYEAGKEKDKNDGPGSTPS